MATRALCCVSARAAPYAHARWPSSSSVTTAAATSPNVTRATRSSARVTRAASSATLPASMSNKSDGDSACDECQQPPFGEGTSADGRSLLAPRLHVARRGVLQRGLDQAEQARLDQVALVEVRRHARGDAAAEDLLPALHHRRPLGLDLVDPAPELAERLRRARAHRADLGVHDLGKPEVVRVGDAQRFEVPSEPARVARATR